MMNSICRAFMEGKCRNPTCPQVHNNQICKFFYFKGECKKGDQCNFLHTKNRAGKYHGTHKNKEKYNKNKRKRVKNTETFEPSHEPTDLRILTTSNLETFDYSEVTGRDLMVIPDLFKDEENLYQRLLDEMKSTGLDDQKLWKSWHGDTHMIADDKLGWKKDCPIFNSVIDRIAKYFNLDVKATRFNWYRNASEWKPFHHDAAAVKKDKAKTQNFTVGVSFGAEREAAFEHAKTRTTISIPLRDGTTYAFSRDVNVEWRHGIPQIPPDTPKSDPEGRISIIVWGWLPSMKCNRLPKDI